MNITTKFSVGEMVTLKRNGAELGPINAIVVKESGLVYRISGWDYPEKELVKSIPPNPYSKGTFAWAWEEVQRGNKVVIQYGDFSVYYWKKDTDYYTQTANSEPSVAVSVMLSDINSTKWELAE